MDADRSSIIAQFSNVKVLSIANNLIGSFDEIIRLRAVSQLHHLKHDKKYNIIPTVS